MKTNDTRETDLHMTKGSFVNSKSKLMISFSC